MGMSPDINNQVEYRSLTLLMFNLNTYPDADALINATDETYELFKDVLDDYYRSNFVNEGDNPSLLKTMGAISKIMPPTPKTVDKMLGLMNEFGFLKEGNDPSSNMYVGALSTFIYKGLTNAKTKEMFYLDPEFLDKSKNKITYLSGCEFNNALEKSFKRTLDKLDKAITTAGNGLTPEKQFLRDVKKYKF